MADEAATGLPGPGPDLNIDHQSADPPPELSSELDTLLDDAGVKDLPPGTEAPVAEPPVINPPAKTDEPPVEEPPKTEEPPKADEPPKTEPPAKEEPKLIDDLDAVRPQPGTSPANLVNFDALRHTAKHYKTIAAEVPALQQKIQELEQRQPEIPPDVQEAIKFKEIFDIENDPSFKSKYDEPLQKHHDTFYDVLKRNGGTDELIKQIQDSGGPTKLSQKWIQDELIAKLPLIDSEKIKKSLLGIGDLTEARAQELEENHKNRDKVLQERQEAETKRFEKEKQEADVMYQALAKELPWVQRQEVPPNATPEQKKAIEEHNKGAEMIEQIYNNALYPQSPAQRAQVALAAALSDRLAGLCQTQENVIKAKDDENAALKAELSKLKGVASPPRTSAPAKVATTKTSPEQRIHMNSEDAIEQGLQEAGA